MDPISLNLSLGELLLLPVSQYTRLYEVGAVLSLRFLSRENSVNDEQNFRRVTSHVNSQLTLTVISLSLERKLFTSPLLCIRNL